MRLLIITQAMDKEDPVLGFFHRWVELLAHSVERVTVICLREGVHTLPTNVRVLSLGKEAKQSRLQYVHRFYRYIWDQQKNYDTVLVHMNQEYALLGGLLWRLLGKRVVLWRNHKIGNFLTHIAVWLVHSVVCTSRSSYTAQFSKTHVLPVGVDIDAFASNGTSRKSHSLLFLGRVSRVKCPDVFVHALCVLLRRDVSFTADIVGDPITPEDTALHTALQKHVASCGGENVIHFHSAVSHDNVPYEYQSHEVYINLTPSGSFDKTIVEAMASGAVVLARNSDAFDVASSETREALLIQSENPDVIADHIERVLGAPPSQKELWRNNLRHAAASHSLVRLIQMLCEVLSPVRK